MATDTAVEQVPVTAGEASTARVRVWQALVDNLRDDRSLIVRRCAAIYAARLRSYRDMDRSELEQLMSDALDRQLDGLCTGRPPADDEDLSVYEELGTVRARQGVALGDLLQAYRLGCDIVRMRAYEIVPASAHRDSVLLRLLELTNAWSDQGMIASAASHRRTELSIMRRIHERRSSFIRRVLSGQIVPSRLLDLGESYGIDVNADYYAIRARPTDDSNAHDIESFLQAGPTTERPRGLVALLDGDVCGFASALPRCEAPSVIGVAGPVPLSEIGRVFRLATRALETAVALGRIGVFSMSDLGLQPAIIADDDIGEALLDRYVRPLEVLGDSASAILATVDRYLTNDCRLEPTARQMYVHVNTVRYRLRRFEEITGGSLRENERLLEVWWALQRRRLTDRTPDDRAS